MATTVIELFERLEDHLGFDLLDPDLGADNLRTSIKTVLRDMTKVERDALRLTNQINRSTESLALSDGISEYALPTTMWGRRIVSARIRENSTSAWHDVDIMQHDALLAGFKQLGSTLTEGMPLALAYSPITDLIIFAQTPDRAYTVELHFSTNYSKLGFPVDPYHFLGKQLLDGNTKSRESTTTGSDFRRTFIDHARTITMVATGATSDNVTLVGLDADRMAQTVVKALNGTTAVVTTETWTQLDTAALPTVSAVNVSIGIGAITDTSVSTNSNLPDQYALEIAPHGAAAKHWGRDGKPRKAGDESQQLAAQLAQMQTELRDGWATTMKRNDSAGVGASSVEPRFPGEHEREYLLR